MAENYDQDKELNRFRGLEVNGGAIDEINECQEATLYKLLERSGSWNNALNNPPIVVLATCNPTTNWVKEKVYDKWISDELPATWKYIPSRITDNPHIPEAYLQSLRDNMPAFEYQKFVEGDWEISEKAVNPFFLAYDPKRHESESVVYDPTKPILISLDFNLQPFCGVVFQYYFDDNNQEHFYAIDEFSVADGSIPKMVDEIKNKYAAALPTCYITGDAMGNRGDISQRDNANYYEQIKRGLKISDRQIVVPKANPTHANSRAE
jgi:hypothetical protein